MLLKSYNMKIYNSKQDLKICQIKKLIREILLISKKLFIKCDLRETKVTNRYSQKQLFCSKIYSKTFVVKSSVTYVKGLNQASYPVPEKLLESIESSRFASHIEQEYQESLIQGKICNKKKNEQKFWRRNTIRYKKVAEVCIRVGLFKMGGS